MKIYNENLTLENFNAWSGAIDTKNTIIENNKEQKNIYHQYFIRLC